MRAPPKIIRCRTYKQFDEKKFKAVFQNYFNEVNSSDLSVDVFKMLFLNALNKFASVRKKLLRANHSKFVNKEYMTKCIRTSIFFFLNSNMVFKKAIMCNITAQLRSRK